MTIFSDAVGFGLTFTLVAASPLCPAPRVEATFDEAGRIVVVVREASDPKHGGSHNHGEHPLHAPATRLLSTDATSLNASQVVVAEPDHLEYVRDAASDRIIVELNGSQMIAHRLR